MSTRSGRIRTSVAGASPPRTRKGLSPSRSPARTRKSSPPARKSPPPARKSPPPARSSGRKSPARKSPGRKPGSKFLARKSPSRATKESAEPAVPKSPAKHPVDSDVSVRLEDFSGKLELYRRTRSKRLEYSVQDVITESEFISDKVNGLESIDRIDSYGLRNRKPVEEVTPRRSSRLREFIDNTADIRRSVSKSLTDSSSVGKSASKSLDAYSDDENYEEEIIREKSRSVTRKLATPLRSSISSLTQAVLTKWEFGGRIGSAFLLLLIPLTVFSILISCQKSHLLKYPLDLSGFKSLEMWFAFHSLAYFASQIMIQAIFALLPIFGSRSDRMDETSTTCFNAFFSGIFTVNLLFLLDYFHVIHKDIILNEYLRLAVISYIFAVVLSIILYLRSLKVGNNELNHFGNTGYKLYDFFMGREIHPFIKNLDVKVWISRISNINCLILLSLIFTQGLQIKFDPNETLSLGNYKELLSKVQFKPTILLFSMMQIIYILNFVMKEYKVTSTFYWQSEGVGYLQIVSSALYPYYFTTISKHVADSKVVLSSNTLILASILFLLGYVIMLVSNNIKHEFRKNPLHPSLANLDSMPTFHGKRLLVAGPWGVLRHPNYAGDILMHIALAIPGILSRQFAAALPALLTIVVLVHRARRDNDRCKRRYGAAWQRYCRRVPSVIIPKLL